MQYHKRNFNKKRKHQEVLHKGLNVQEAAVNYFVP